MDKNCRNKVEAVLHNIIYEVFQNFPQNKAWRISYFYEREKFWPFYADTIKNELKKLGRMGATKILVVPVTIMIPDLDTITLLSSKLAKLV